MLKTKSVSRRQFLKGSVGAAAAFTIVPRSVLGGPNRTPPSETFGAALIGCGGRSNGTFNAMGLEAKKLAMCDVKFVGRADNKSRLTGTR